MTRDLEDYIKRHTQKGVSTSRIRNALIQAGHSKQAVKKAFKNTGQRASNAFWWFVGIAVLVIIAIIVIFIFIPKAEVTTPVQEIVELEAFTIPIEQRLATNEEMEVINEVLRTGNISLCDSIVDKNSSPYVLCNFGFWEEYLCGFLESVQGFEASDECNFDKATAESSYSACLSIKGYNLSRLCFSNALSIALENNDVLMCGLSIPCYVKFGLATGCSITFPEELDEDFKTSAKNECYYQLAILNNDPSSCNSITPTDYRREKCEIFGKLISGDSSGTENDELIGTAIIFSAPEICDLVEGNRIYDPPEPTNDTYPGTEDTVFDETFPDLQELCVAVTDSEGSRCDTLQNNDWKSLCNAISEKDLNSCQGISDNEAKQLCTTIVSLTPCDYSACKPLFETSYGFFCGTIAENVNQISEECIVNG